MINLNINIGGIRYKNPVFLASGTAGFGFEFAEIFNIGVLGGIVTKTITPRQREGNPPPRICEVPCGMLNSIGLANPGLDAFMKDIAPKLWKLPTAIIVSVAGESEDDFCTLVKTVSQLDFVKAVELNLSCPNVEKGGIHFGRDNHVVSNLMKRLRTITSKKLWAKLSPMVTDIVSLAQSAQDGGADAVVIANTLPAMAIDIYTRKSKIGAITGGLSGAAIHPVTVALIYQLRGKINIPIIGVGGITHPEDAVEMMIAGATAVQIGSGAFPDPMLPKKTLDFLKKYCEKLGINKTSEIVGN